MSTQAFRRNPLIISGNSLSSGDHSTTFPSGSPDALLRNYLIFVRDLRGQRREPSIELRSEDVHVLAGHLGVTEELVLGGLLDLMGATRAQRSAMMAMLAAGALTLVLTGSFVADLSSDGVSVEMARLADAVHTAVHDAEAGTTSAAVGTSTPTPGRTSSAHAPGSLAHSVHSAAPAPDVALVERSAGPSTGSGPVVERRTTLVESIAAPATVDGDVEGAGPVAGEPMSIAVAPDGSLVASVAPPLPPPPADHGTATAQLPDGTTVGVGTPPVPPPTPDPTPPPADHG